VGILPRVIAATPIARGEVEVVYEESDSDLAYHILTRPGPRSRPLTALIRWLKRQAAN